MRGVCLGQRGGPRGGIKLMRISGSPVGNSLLGRSLSLKLRHKFHHIFSMLLVRVPVNPYSLGLVCLPIVSALVFVWPNGAFEAFLPIDFETPSSVLYTDHDSIAM